MIYFPERYPGGLYSEGARLPGLEDCTLTAEDGVKLHGWFLSSEATERTILFFHGNAGNLSYRLDMLVAMHALPARVFIVDYRGYGKSEGSPSESGLYADARAAWRFLTDEKGIPPGKIVIFGKSLGGAPACELATEVSPGGLIVQSSFASVPAMARLVFPFMPGFLVTTKMDSLRKVPGIACPKLFIHSKRDEVIPFRQGRALFEAACEPKAFYEVVGAGHNETHLVGGRAYWDRLGAFLDACC
jgi:fermentation-respiration switch protein FrsA (DUF1100 family)